jgi:hypothetical protein
MWGQGDEKAVHADFGRALGENHSFAKFLTKMFRRKIKRRRAEAEKSGTGEGAAGPCAGRCWAHRGSHCAVLLPGSDNEEEDEEEEDEEEDEGSDTEDFDDSVCPTGCDQILYQQVHRTRCAVGKGRKRVAPLSGP